MVVKDKEILFELFNNDVFVEPMDKLTLQEMELYIQGFRDAKYQLMDIIDKYVNGLIKHSLK